MVRFKQSMVLVGVMMVAPAIATEQDYRDEIYELAIKPCWEEIIKDNELDKKFGSMESALRVMESLPQVQKDKEASIEVTIPIVSEMSRFKDRLAFYEIGKNACLAAARGRGNRVSS